MNLEKRVTKELVTAAKANLAPLSRADAMRWLERAEPQLHRLIERCSAKVATTLQKIGSDKATISTVEEALERSTMLAIESLKLCHLFCGGRNGSESDLGDRLDVEARVPVTRTFSKALASRDADAQESGVDWLCTDAESLRRMPAEKLMRVVENVDPDSATYLKKNFPRIVQPLGITNASDEVIGQLRQNFMRTFATAVLAHRRECYAFCEHATGGMSVPEIDRLFRAWRKAKESERRNAR